MKEFDFDHIGKRMPYSTPYGFFDQLEDDIWKEVQTDCQEEKKGKTITMPSPQAGRKPARMHLIMRSVVAVAASVALLFVVHMNFTKPSSISANDVDQAFSQLTTDDQAYLLSVYQDDVFINE